MKATMEELAPYMRGWRSYFGFCETPKVLIDLIGWVREATEGSYVAAVENTAPSPGSPTGTGGARAAGEKYRRQWSRPLVPREGSGSFFATHLRTPALEEWHAFRPTQRPIGTRRRNRGRKRREARWRWFYLLQIIRSVSRRESPATVKLVVKPFGI
jgi:hypothetical protein